MLLCFKHLSRCYYFILFFILGARARVMSVTNGGFGMEMGGFLGQWVHDLTVGGGGGGGGAENPSSRVSIGA